MNAPVHPRLRGLLDLMGLLEDLAEEQLQAAQKAYKKHVRVRRGSTLRPGAHTPLWNELAKHAAVELRRYGDKAKLGRYLGLPRQRVHQLIVERSAFPDAERTLLLLVWLQARLHARELW